VAGMAMFSVQCARRDPDSGGAEDGDVGVGGEGSQVRILRLAKEELCRVE
jgi:hypothetical protein